MRQYCSKKSGTTAPKEAVFGKELGGCANDVGTTTLGDIEEEAEGDLTEELESAREKGAFSNRSSSLRNGVARVSLALVSMISPRKKKVHFQTSNNGEKPTSPLIKAKPSTV